MITKIENVFNAVKIKIFIVLLIPWQPNVLILIIEEPDNRTKLLPVNKCTNLKYLSKIQVLAHLI